MFLTIAVSVAAMLWLLAQILPVRRSKGAFGCLVAGEQGSLLPRGPMSKQARIRRLVELHEIISRLAVITRLNLPLYPALQAAAKGESRRVAQVLRETGRLVGKGLPLSEALEAALPGCPVQLVEALRMTEALGQSARALAEQERMIAARIDVYLGSTHHARDAALYVSVMALLGGAMLTCIMIIVMPRFRNIFVDYTAPLPGVTLVLIDAARWFAGYGWIALCMVLACLFVGGLACARASTKDRVGIVVRAVAALRRMIPITRTVDYGLGMAKIIRATASGIRIGAPTSFMSTLPSVVSKTNHLHPCVTAFARGVSDGVAPQRAARDSQLGDVFVCALNLVERGADPDQVLGHAADYYEAIAYRWWHALVAVSGPIATLAVAALVGFIAFALFLPLVTLINTTAETI